MTDKFSDIALSLIIPAYNEEENIEAIVGKANDVFKKHFRVYEIIIVNDGSTDQTGKMAEELTRRIDDVRVVHHKSRKGLGEALKTGYCNAKLQYISFIPADGQIEPEEIIRLVKAVNGKEMVLSNYQVRLDTHYRLFISKCWRKLMKILLGFDLGSEGPYLFRRHLLNKIELKSSTGLLNLEFPMKVANLGYEMNCVKISCKPRLRGSSKVANISTTLKIFYEMMKLRWFQ
jgi:glycosyltransferase involved in cell wall biosynthesis